MTSGDQTPDELRMVLEAVTAVMPPAVPGQINVGQRFEALSVGAVRPAHARTAFLGPDDLVAFEYGHVQMIVASKAVRPDDGPPFCLVAIAYVQAGGPWTITGAWRLYARDVESLSVDARHAFETLLLRYAIPYLSGGRRVFFVPVHIFPRESGPFNPIAAFGVDTTQGHGIFVHHSRQNPDGSVTFAWPLFFDLTRYKADMDVHF